MDDILYRFYMRRGLGWVYRNSSSKGRSYVLYDYRLGRLLFTNDLATLSFVEFYHHGACRLFVRRIFSNGQNSCPNACSKTVPRTCIRSPYIPDCHRGPLWIICERIVLSMGQAFIINRNDRHPYLDIRHAASVYTGFSHNLIWFIPAWES